MDSCWCKQWKQSDRGTSAWGLCVHVYSVEKVGGYARVCSYAFTLPSGL